MSTDRRVSDFYRGEAVRGLRPKLNRLSNRANAALSPNSGASIGEQVDRNFGSTLYLEIKAFLAHPTLQCVFPGEAANPSAETYNVVPPPTFYEASRAGVTYSYTDINTRSATDGGTPESQYLWPSYVVGDLILCDLVVTYDGAGELWYWLDRNVDGRQWVADVS